MRIRQLHGWDLDCQQARNLQKRLAEKVDFCPVDNIEGLKLAAGLDCAFSKDKTKILAVVVVINVDTFEIAETQHAIADVTFPYIPGLLSFREAPVCIDAVEKLQITPDVFLIDGQGIAHPRRLGLGSHLGLFFDKPTVGCAKSRLIGTYTEPDVEKGSYRDLMYKDEKAGVVLRTRTNVKPLFISPGHKCSFDDAINITLRCTTKYRLPEPTRMAHNFVSSLK